MTQTTARFDLPGFKGTLIHPGDDEYDGARTIFNGMIDRNPAFIGAEKEGNPRGSNAAVRRPNRAP